MVRSLKQVSPTRESLMKMQWIFVIGLIALFSLGCRNRAKETASPSTPVSSTTATPAPAAPAGVATPAAEELPRTAENPRHQNRLHSPRPRPAKAPPATIRPTIQPPVSAPIAATEAPPQLPPSPTPAWREVTIAEGTVLLLALSTELSSETATGETPVRARLRDAIQFDGVIVLPKNAVLLGGVTDVARSGR